MKVWAIMNSKQCSIVDFIARHTPMDLDVLERKDRRKFKPAP
jgi:hypothetical protein